MERPIKRNDFTNPFYWAYGHATSKLHITLNLLLYLVIVFGLTLSIANTQSFDFSAGLRLGLIILFGFLFLTEAKNLFEKLHLFNCDHNDRYRNLSCFYKSIKIMALEQLRASGDNLKKFPIEKVERFLKKEEKGKLCAILLGELDKNKNFSPELTNRMLRLHGLISWYNDELDKLEETKKENLQETLKIIIRDSIYFEHAFNYLSEKEELIAKEVKGDTVSKAFKQKLNKIFKKNVNRISQDYNGLRQSKVNMCITDKFWENTRLMNVTWEEYDVTERSKTIAHYLLPWNFANFHLLNLAMVKIPKNIQAELLKKFHKLSAGDLSILDVMLTKREGAVATTKTSNNYAFFEILVKLGLAEEQPMELETSPEIIQNVTSFAIKEGGFNLVGRLLDTRK